MIKRDANRKGSDKNGNITGEKEVKRNGNIIMVRCTLERNTDRLIDRETKL